ncbi:hypothetical protein DPMN_004707 [Dreissena polymorpha]|uniref:Uncharacterized protein n=1 Tax=Dreissena polymorpha TaxID=45954 RepID=A0A9D4RVU5_DREPO|nr:hypothetical protein DPMN_004707 [Dreissena polymorpha]
MMNSGYDLFDKPQALVVSDGVRLRKSHSKKKGKKKKDDDSLDSPRPLGMPPAYPISDSPWLAQAAFLHVLRGQIIREVIENHEVAAVQRFGFRSDKPLKSAAYHSNKMCIVPSSLSSHPT